MSLFSLLVPLFVCGLLPLCLSDSEVTFLSIQAENVDGGMQVNATTNTTLASIAYLIFTECSITGSNDTSEFTPPENENNPSCSSFTFTSFQSCCDDCMSDSSTQLTQVITGPLQAGENYTCYITGMFDGETASITADSVIATSGIPSRPSLALATEEDTLNVTVSLSYNGDADSIKYRVQVQNTTSAIVHDSNYTSMSFQISDLGNGNYSIISWAINTYGSSTNEQGTFLINATVADAPDSDATLVGMGVWQVMLLSMILLQALIL